MYYDYDCPKCGRMEIQHKMNEKIKECPKCKSKEIRIVISGGFGFRLKGKGWAKDGYTKD